MAVGLDRAMKKTSSKGENALMNDHGNVGVANTGVVSTGVASTGVANTGVASTNPDCEDGVTALVLLTQQGNRFATEELFGQAYIYVYSYVRHMCGDEEVAKDLTQETIARAIANISRFRGASHFNTWVCGIATNTYKDYVKKQARLRQAFSGSEGDSCGIFDGDSHAVNGDSHAVLGTMKGLVPEDAQRTFLQKEFKVDLSHALKALPKSQREAFVLKHLVGLSYQQVAEATHCPIGTVRSRLHKGIAVLQKLLKERGWP